MDNAPEKKESWESTRPQEGQKAPDFNVNQLVARLLEKPMSLRDLALEITYGEYLRKSFETVDTTMHTVVSKKIGDYIGALEAANDPGVWEAFEFFKAINLAGIAIVQKRNSHLAQ